LSPQIPPRYSEYILIKFIIIIKRQKPSQTSAGGVAQVLSFWGCKEGSTYTNQKT
jgi:hypothetical protein